MDLTRAYIVTDSLNTLGNRLITIEMTYPRIIHAEVMSYCSFARNANSSRAMTPNSMIAAVRDNPFVPEIWRRAAVRGMTPDGKLSAENAQKAREIWLEAASAAVAAAKKLADMMTARELVNRLLEPFSYIKSIVTADWPMWANFLCQRTAMDAQYEIRVLATSVAALIRDSTPVVLESGHWHTPYGNPNDDVTTRIKTSVARCASVSYRTPRMAEWNESKVIDAEIALFDRLQRDAHWSPFEHQALAWVPSGYRGDMDSAVPYRLRGKFADGWVQHRKTISGEVFRDFNLASGSIKPIRKAEDEGETAWSSFARELVVTLERSLGTKSGEK